MEKIADFPNEYDYLITLCFPNGEIKNIKANTRQILALSENGICISNFDKIYKCKDYCLKKLNSKGEKNEK